MNAAIVIPTYWAGESTGMRAPGTYDHSTSLDDPAPDLERCLKSLEQVRKCARIILLVVCPIGVASQVDARVREIASQHQMLNITVVGHSKAAHIADAIDALTPRGVGEVVSLRGYGAIRNMGLVCAGILGHDAVIFLDDDELVLEPDFMRRALYALGQETRAGEPILAKSGYFYDRNGSPLADPTRSGFTNRWWTKRVEFNQWMKKALAGTRISRSNYVCGGCFAIHARAFSRVAFDPFITRGEDLDYLFNMRLQGMNVWFDNQWVVKHLPPPMVERSPRFMQDVYRWYYERAKLAHASRQPDLNAVTPATLMPYPGPWISSELDERVRKTAFVRTFFTREHRGYWHIWQHGRAEAERYARENQTNYLRFQNFWPKIMNSLWGDKELAAMLEEN